MASLARGLFVFHNPAAVPFMVQSGADVSFFKPPFQKGDFRLNTFTSLLNAAIHGDCLKVMPTLPSESIDLVIADPPYLVNYLPRDRRTVANDGDNAWLEPAFAEIYRLHG